MNTLFTILTFLLFGYILWNVLFIKNKSIDKNKINEIEKELQMEIPLSYYKLLTKGLLILIAISIIGYIIYYLFLNG